MDREIWVSPDGEQEEISAGLSASTKEVMRSANRTLGWRRMKAEEAAQAQEAQDEKAIEVLARRKLIEQRVAQRAKEISMEDAQVGMLSAFLGGDPRKHREQIAAWNRGERSQGQSGADSVGGTVAGLMGGADKLAEAQQAWEDGDRSAYGNVTPSAQNAAVVARKRAERGE